jgi:hypothetical protein
VDDHPRASVFHLGSWMQALQNTYGFEPVGVTTDAPGEPLSSAMAACRVRSWITGRHVISMPFSDHCDPLVSSDPDLGRLAGALEQEAAGAGSSFEMRPIGRSTPPAPGLRPGSSSCLHWLDLRPGADAIFERFHKSSMQRRVRRGEAAGLSYREGNEPGLLDAFYRMVVVTRRRQGLPPQPRVWFENLLTAMGPRARIHLVAKGAEPAAGMLTLRHRTTIVYKYGASAPDLKELGSTPLLFWKVVCGVCQEGFLDFDLGRSDWDNPGLIRFKDRLGAERIPLDYWRSGPAPARAGWTTRAARHVFGNLPVSVLPLVGRLTYRHLSAVSAPSGAKPGAGAVEGDS